MDGVINVTTWHNKMTNSFQNLKNVIHKMLKNGRNIVGCPNVIMKYNCI